MASQSMAACRSTALSSRFASARRVSEQLSESAFVPAQEAAFCRQHKLGSRAFREKREQMRIAAKLPQHGPAETNGQRRGSVRTHFATDYVADSASSSEQGEYSQRRGPYIAEAAVGMVVCSAKGCRPVFYNPSEAAAERSKGVVCTEERPEEPLPARKKPAYPDGFVDYLNEVWLEKDVAQRLYEKELSQNPRSAKILASYAAFAHKEQNDVALADRLYRQALQEAPENADVLSSYALFLWQTEV